MAENEPTERDRRTGSLLWQGVDFRIPIWGVAGALGTVIWALVSSHFAQQQLTKDVAAVQMTIEQGQKAANAQFAEIAVRSSANNVDVAELRIRIANMEASVNRLYGVPYSSGAAASARAEAKASR